MDTQKQHQQYRDMTMEQKEKNQRNKTKKDGRKRREENRTQE